MSQMTATARPLRAPRRSAAPVSPLRVLPARIGSSGNGAFATLCIVMLTAGLIALLLLNTALAQGSLGVGQLQRDSARLTDAASNLQEDIDRASASGALARSASQLGMVRMNRRAYIDLRTGKVTGEAEPATKALAVTIVTSPMPLAVTKKVKSVLKSATSVATRAQTSAAKAAERAAAAAAAASAAAAAKAAADQKKKAEAAGVPAPGATPAATPGVTPGATTPATTPGSTPGSTPGATPSSTGATGTAGGTATLGATADPSTGTAPTTAR